MKFTKVIDNILGPEELFSFEDRILNAVLFISSIIGILACIFDLLLGVLKITSLLTALISLLLVSLYLFGRKKSRYRLIVFPYFTILYGTVILIWYFFDGISGTSNVYILVIVMLVPIVTRGLTQIIVLAALLIISTIILFVELNNPGIVQNYRTPEAQIIDTFLSTIFISIGIITVISFMLYSYNKQRREIEDLIRIKNKFFSIIAHDLKGPLASMTQLGEFMLQNEDNINKKQRKKMEESIYESSKNTYTLLENLLQWSIAESGQLVPKATKVHISSLVDETRSLLKAQINQKQLNIKINIKKNLYFLVDKNMINLVLRNLISNAIKFTVEKGEIRIEARLIPDTDQVILSIKDNGIGIEKDALPKLFDLDSSYRKKGTNRESGTGLGLKLCKEFLLKNNGDILVTSEIGKGSEFIIQLPGGRE